MTDSDADAVLGADEAAELLGVGVEVLRRWERQFGFPRASPDEEGEPTYVHSEIVALRNELLREFSVAAAIDKLRRHGRPPQSRRG